MKQTEWAEQVRAIELQDQVERRKHERLFRLAPCMDGLLVDEFPSSKREARSAEELSWAEARVTSELSFEKIAEGQNISYVRDIEGHFVFADIRIKETITFYLYRLPDGRKRRSEAPNHFPFKTDLAANLKRSGTPPSSARSSHSDPFDRPQFRFYNCMSKSLRSCPELTLPIAPNRCEVPGEQAVPDPIQSFLCMMSVREP